MEGPPLTSCPIYRAVYMVPHTRALWMYRVVFIYIYRAYIYIHILRLRPCRRPLLPCGTCKVFRFAKLRGFLRTFVWRLKPTSDWALEELKSLTVLLLCFETYEHLRLWTIKGSKSLTVSLLCIKIYEYLRFWEIEEPKSKTVLLLWLKTYENLMFWKIEEPKSKNVLLLCLKTYESFRF